MTHVTDALDIVRADLQRLRADRIKALAFYLSILTVFIAVQAWMPSGSAGPRPLGWYLGLAGLFLGATMSVALALGVPLLHGRRFTVALCVSVAVMAAGLLVAMDLDAPMGLTHGPVCFTFGTVVSALFVMILGALSGRLWRRFPDPSFMVALAATAAGMMFLHIKCDAWHPAHLLLFHATPLALLFVGARWLSQLRMRLLIEDGQDRQ